jgi:hypothetical protein
VSGPRTVTVHTRDHGPVTITCPAWCSGAHDDGGFRVDIDHTGPLHRFMWHDYELGIAELAQAPFGRRRDLRASIDLGEVVQALEPDELRDLAAHLIHHAGQLHALAAQLADLRAQELRR